MPTNPTDDREREPELFLRCKINREIWVDVITYGKPTPTDIDHLLATIDSLRATPSGDAEQVARDVVARWKANIGQVVKYEETQSALAASLRATTNSAYERAAQECDKFAKQNHDGAVKAIKRDDYIGHDVLDSCKREAEACAAAIRALRDEG